MAHLVVSHREAHPHQASFPNGNPFLDNAATTDVAAGANVHIAIEDSAGGNMAVVFDTCIMLNKCSRVDNAVIPHLGASIDDGAVHHNGACANGGVPGDMGGRRDDDRQLKPKLGGPLIETDAAVWRQDLPHGNKGVLIGLGEFWQVTVRSDNGIAKMLGMHFLRHADQPGNLVSALLLDDIDTCMGMTASTDQNQIWFAHEPTVPSPELLGILIKRCESDLAPARSMLEQFLNGVNSCIRN